jgi:hypothetical protein
MNKLIERFSGLVKSTLSGFDRIVFKGLILSLMSAVRFRSAGILAPSSTEKICNWPLRRGSKWANQV